jgi:hypothetical protein
MLLLIVPKESESLGLIRLKVKLKKNVSSCGPATYAVI